MPDSISDAAAERAAASLLEGSGMLKDANDLATKLSAGDWAEGILAGVSAAYDLREGLKDPLAKLTSMGLGWVIEFFGPLRSVLDWLTGNQEQLNVIVETWSGVAGQMSQAADDLHRHYTTDAAHWSGSAVTQYRLYCADQVDLYRAASVTAMSVSNNARLSGMVLTTVREVIRGLVTDAVGKAISIISRYPPPTTPGAAPEVTATVVETGNRIRQWLDKLTRAFTNAKEMLQASNGLFKKLRYYLSTADTYSSLERAAAHDLAVFGEVASRVKDFAVRAAKEIPGEIPGAVFEEGVKSAAGAAIGAEKGPEAPPEKKQLYDGPGRHRVTGTL